jgi:hypothetical protein
VRTGSDGLVTPVCGSTMPTPSGMKGDYPYRGQTSGIDPWHYHKGRRTSFVAWRLNNRNDIKFNGGPATAGPPPRRPAEHTRSVSGETAPALRRPSIVAPQRLPRVRCGATWGPGSVTAVLFVRAGSAALSEHRACAGIAGPCRGLGACR